MGQFYKHNILESRKARNFRFELVQLTFEIGTDEWFAENQILKLLDICTRGLPDCYKSFDNMLADFWADFAWDPKAQAEQVKIIQKDPRFNLICETLKADWDFDLTKELNSALAIA